MAAKKMVSPTRRYVAMLNKANWDGYEFRTFNLPDNYDNNAEAATRYVLTEDCLCSPHCVFPAEDLTNFHPFRPTFGEVVTVSPPITAPVVAVA